MLLPPGFSERQEGEWKGLKMKTGQELFTFYVIPYYHFHVNTRCFWDPGLEGSTLLMELDKK